MLGMIFSQVANSDYLTANDGGSNIKQQILCNYKVTITQIHDFGNAQYDFLFAQYDCG